MVNSGGTNVKGCYSVLNNSSWNEKYHWQEKKMKYVWWYKVRTDKHVRQYIIQSRSWIGAKKSKLQRKKNCRFNSHHSNQFGHYEIYISNHHLKLMEFVQKELVALFCKIIVLFHNFVGTIFLRGSAATKRQCKKGKTRNMHTVSTLTRWCDLISYILTNFMRHELFAPECLVWIRLVSDVCQSVNKLKWQVDPRTSPPQGTLSGSVRWISHCPDWHTDQAGLYSQPKTMQSSTKSGNEKNDFV